MTEAPKAATMSDAAERLRIPSNRCGTDEGLPASPLLAVLTGQWPTGAEDINHNNLPTAASQLCVLLEPDTGGNILPRRDGKAGATLVIHLTFWDNHGTR